MTDNSFNPSLALHTSMAKELRLRGPATHSQLRRYFSVREIDVAVRKQILYVYSIRGSRVKLYDLGSAGAGLVGVKYHEPRSTLGLFDAFSLRYAIEWYEEQGWRCVEREKQHMAYMAEQAHPGDPAGDRELIVVKHSDYSRLGAKNLIAREAQYAYARGGYRVTFLVRDPGFGANLEKRHGINAITRDYREMVAAAPDEIRFLLMDYHI